MLKIRYTARTLALCALMTALAATPATRADPGPVITRPRMTTCCSIVELRQYTTYPGQRDALISLFEREFIDGQEAAGMVVIAQFRDVNDPHRFVWLRGFPDMPARARSLTEFYTGPVWKAHRDAANATLYDSDNVLLLHPARDGAGFALAGAQRRTTAVTPASAPGPGGFVVVTAYYFARPVTPDFVRWFDEALAPRFTASGATVLAELASDASENTFPRLPVREGENAFVWLAQFDDRGAYERYLARLAADPRWRSELFATLHKQLARYPEVIMLAPTPRSLVGHAGSARAPR
jgi:hypothetical protein